MDQQTALGKALAEAAARGEITSGFISKHFGGPPMNENNFGLGYVSPQGWMAGAYRNSLNKPSLYAGREFTRNLFGNVDGGVVLGGATGYGRPVTPLVLPELIYRNGDRRFAATVVPPVGGAPATLALQVRKSF